MTIDNKVVKEKYEDIESMFKEQKSIPICMYCGKIRYDNDWYTHPIHEDYRNYSHSVCPRDYEIHLKDVKGTK